MIKIDNANDDWDNVNDNDNDNDNANDNDYNDNANDDWNRPRQTCETTLQLIQIGVPDRRNQGLRSNAIFDDVDW